MAPFNLTWETGKESSQTMKAIKVFGQVPFRRDGTYSRCQTVDLHQHPNEGHSRGFPLVLRCHPFQNPNSGPHNQYISTKQTNQQDTKAQQNQQKQVSSIGRDELSLPQPAWLLRIQTNSHATCPVRVPVFCWEGLWWHTEATRSKNICFSHLSKGMPSIFLPRFPFEDLPNQSTNWQSILFQQCACTQSCPKEDLCVDLSGCYQGQL